MENGPDSLEFSLGSLHPHSLCQRILALPLTCGVVADPGTNPILFHVNPYLASLLLGCPEAKRVRSTRLRASVYSRKDQPVKIRQQRSELERDLRTALNTAKAAQDRIPSVVANINAALKAMTQHQEAAAVLVPIPINPDIPAPCACALPKNADGVLTLAQSLFRSVTSVTSNGTRWLAVTGGADARLWVKDLAHHKPIDMDQAQGKLSSYTYSLCVLPWVQRWLEETGFGLIQDALDAAAEVAAAGAMEDE